MEVQPEDFVPFVAGLAFFIFLSNVFGLIFFLQPPTANTSTTFALSLTAFVRSSSFAQKLALG